MAKTWLSVRVDLLHGSPSGDLRPPPGRVFVVGPRHSFRNLADAIDDVFARWDRSQLREFTLADRRVLADRGPERNGPVEDYAGLLVARTASSGSEFRYVSDPGDWWVHRCTVGPGKVDPVDVLGVEPTGRCPTGDGEVSPTSTGVAGTATTARHPSPTSRSTRTR